ncbi:MAG: hypothetical protein AABX10_02600 [Nanoarchaeota archaeon]|mgnify:CR=1 FL=1
MADEIISLRIDKSLKEKMRLYNHINWSAILRRALIEEINKMHRIDKKRAMKAALEIDKIRKSGVFNGGKTGTQIIREWRDKKR